MQFTLYVLTCGLEFVHYFMLQGTRDQCIIKIEDHIITSTVAEWLSMSNTGMSAICLLQWYIEDWNNNINTVKTHSLLSKYTERVLTTVSKSNSQMSYIYVLHDHYHGLCMF